MDPSQQRTLRSKRDRAALYLEADGKCQGCGCDLPPGWHADHEVPYHVTHRTVAAEMRALCPKCNLAKGGKMQGLRKHQEEAVLAARDIKAGRLRRKAILAHVTPGGGKTLMASLFAHELLRDGAISRVCWVCPRHSLTTQVEESSTNASMGCDRRIRRADNTPPLVRDMSLGCIGYVTTYQAVAAIPVIHEREISQYDYLLILDEPHHLCDQDGRSWYESLKPLVAAAKYVLLMTGTAERHDGVPIPFVEYITNGGGKLAPKCDIRYSRREALAEGAILPIAFQHVDGWARFMEGATKKQVDISKAKEEEVGKVIRTFLGQTKYREAMINKGLSEWMAYKRETGHQSRAIVVCARQAMAKSVQAHIAKRFGVEVALAITDEPDAAEVIRRFRRKERGQVLVTVGMAYEGLDVPDCTHLVCLTDTRSVPWLEQCFARVTRVDHRSGLPYDRQHAFVYVPDDILMQQIVERLRKEESLGIEDRAERATREAGDLDRTENPFLGLEAEATGVTHGDWAGRYSDPDSQIVEAVKTQVPAAAAIAPADILRMREIMSRPAANRAPEASDEPLSERAASLRRSIQNACNKLDRHKGQEFGVTNKELYAAYGKPREAMSIAELEEVLAHLMRMWKEAGCGNEPELALG